MNKYFNQNVKIFFSYYNLQNKVYFNFSLFNKPTTILYKNFINVVIDICLKFEVFKHSLEELGTHPHKYAIARANPFSVD